MIPRDDDQIVTLGGAVALASVEPREGVDWFRAVVRVERVDGEPREQTIEVVAQIAREGVIVRALVAKSSEVFEEPARAWLAVVGTQLRVMCATTGPALRCRVTDLAIVQVVQIGPATAAPGHVNVDTNERQPS